MQQTVSLKTILEMGQAIRKPTHDQDLFNQHVSNLEQLYNKYLTGEVKKSDLKTEISSLNETYNQALKMKREMFCFPSHNIMFSVIALFSGKPDYIPKKLISKPFTKRTEEESKVIDDFTNSVIKTEIEVIEKAFGGTIREEKKVALLCDNKKVIANANLADSLFYNNIIDREAYIAHAIRRTCGPEGLRHLFGLIIAIQEKAVNGALEWDVNDHLEILGYKRKKNYTYPIEAKVKASQIIKIFTDLFLCMYDKEKGGKQTVNKERLFYIEGLKEITDEFNKDILDIKIRIRACNFWYNLCNDNTVEQYPQYTKLLRKIARESHRSHPITIFLAPLFAMYWRIKMDRVFRLPFILNWLDIDMKDHNLKDRLKKLVQELNYMKKENYIGEWSFDGKQDITVDDDLSKCKFICTPPDWLRSELSPIALNKCKNKHPLLPGKKRRTYKRQTEVTEVQEDIISRDEFLRILKESGLNQVTFAEKLDISQSMITRIKNGTRNINQSLSDKIRRIYINPN